MHNNQNIMLNYYISWRAPGIGLFGVDLLSCPLLGVFSELILNKFVVRSNNCKTKIKTF